MKLVLNFALIIGLLVGSQLVAMGQRPVEINTGLVTMYSVDPLSQSLCFRDGGVGHIFEAGQTKNRCSDLNFGSYSADGFSVGIEGSRQGAIIDLGSADELGARYGYKETVGKGQGYASIVVKNGRAMIMKDAREGTLQEMTESAGLFAATDKRGYSSVPVKLGHIYLVRISDSREKDYEMIAKLIVVGHSPTQSVTVRWQLLPNEYIAKNEWKK